MLSAPVNYFFKSWQTIINVLFVSIIYPLGILNLFKIAVRLTRCDASTIDSFPQMNMSKVLSQFAIR